MQEIHDIFIIWFGRIQWDSETSFCLSWHHNFGRSETSQRVPPAFCTCPLRAKPGSPIMLLIALEPGGLFRKCCEHTKKTKIKTKQKKKTRNLHSLLPIRACCPWDWCNLHSQSRRRPLLSAAGLWIHSLLDHEEPFQCCRFNDKMWNMITSWVKLLKTQLPRGTPLK